MAMESGKLLLTLALSQGLARSSLIDPFLLLLSPRPTCRHFPHRHFSRRTFLATLLAAILLTDIVLITSYCTTSRHCSCNCERCAKHVTNLAIILVASFSPPYSLHLTRSHTRRVLLAIVLATGTLVDIVLLTGYFTTPRCLSL